MATFNKWKDSTIYGKFQVSDFPNGTQANAIFDRNVRVGGNIEIVGNLTSGNLTAGNITSTSLTTSQISTFGLSVTGNFNVGGYISSLHGLELQNNGTTTNPINWNNSSITENTNASGFGFYTTTPSYNFYGGFYGSGQLPCFTISNSGNVKAFSLTATYAVSSDYANIKYDVSCNAIKLNGVDLTNSLSLKANLVSPTFTGIPLAPTAVSGTNNTQIATTAFVANSLSTFNFSSYQPLLTSVSDVILHDVTANYLYTNSLNAAVIIANNFISITPTNNTNISTLNFINYNDNQPAVSINSDTFNGGNFHFDLNTTYLPNGYAFNVDGVQKLQITNTGVTATQLTSSSGRIVLNNTINNPAIIDFRDPTGGVTVSALNTNITSGKFIFDIESSLDNGWSFQNTGLNEVMTISLLGDVSCKSVNVVGGVNCSNLNIGGTNIASSLSLKANLISPNFTGTPLAPTAVVGTNTQQLATTAFVSGTLSTYASLAGNNVMTGNNIMTGSNQFNAGIISPIINSLSNVNIQYNGTNQIITTSTGVTVPNVLTAGTISSSLINGQNNPISFQNLGVTQFQTTSTGVYAPNDVDISGNLSCTGTTNITNLNVTNLTSSPSIVAGQGLNYSFTSIPATGTTTLTTSNFCTYCYCNPTAVKTIIVPLGTAIGQWLSFTNQKTSNTLTIQNASGSTISSMGNGSPTLKIAWTGTIWISVA